MEDKLRSLEEKINAISSTLLDFQKHSVASFNQIDQNFDAIKAILNSHSNDLTDVDGKLTEIKEEVMKIQKVSNYHEEYENLLKIVK